MSDINKFTDLLNIVKEIGITVSEKTRQFLVALDEGVEISGSDQLLETEDGLFDIAPNGDLFKISIFINQKNARENPQFVSADYWHKFHLYRCQTIKSYPVSRRYRYKKTNNMQGLFQYIISYNNSEYKKEERLKGRKLNLCKYCQRQLPKEFLRYDVGAFPLDLFYKNRAKSNFTDTFEYDHDQVPQFYSKNWDKIANDLKNRRMWKCELCNLDLSDNKKYLHAHK